jgi:hypothetical protein
LVVQTGGAEWYNDGWPGLKPPEWMNQRFITGGGGGGCCTLSTKFRNYFTFSNQRNKRVSCLV